MRTLTAAAILAAILGAVAGGAPAIAQTQALPQVTQLEGMDFDTLIACSIAYQRVGELYKDQGRSSDAESYANSSVAYSAAAFHVLGYAQADPDAAYRYAEPRMKAVVDSLNASAAAHEQGELGVIGEWHTYCDSIGPNVEYALEQREARGW